MRYDPRMVQPMRDDLTNIGFTELLDTAVVDEVVGSKDGTLLVVVNSVCGCAAGKARPGVAKALQNQARPQHLATVFAGMEMDATNQTRGYFHGYPPSSPQIALFKDGELVHMMERHDIEGRDAEQISSILTGAFDEHCAAPAE
jgi:putative YphP/YqiW family bacilliredoxin